MIMELIRCGKIFLSFLPYSLSADNGIFTSRASNNSCRLKFTILAVLSKIKFAICPRLKQWHNITYNNRYVKQISLIFSFHSQYNVTFLVLVHSKTSPVIVSTHLRLSVFNLIWNRFTSINVNQKHLSSITSYTCTIISRTRTHNPYTITVNL